MTAVAKTHKFKNLEEVKKAIRDGVEVYICYGDKRSQHSGLLYWNKTHGYMRRFLGMTLEYDFNKGRNNETKLYFVKN